VALSSVNKELYRLTVAALVTVNSCIKSSVVITMLSVVLVFAVRIVNLEPGAQAPVVILQGRSLLPFCHIDLEESDYLTSGRRNPNLSLPQSGIDPSTHVLEFRATGVGMFVERHFPVVNPTDVDYSFKWINRDEVVDQSKKPPFRCCVPSGSIISGQQCTVSSVVRY